MLTPAAPSLQVRSKSLRPLYELATELKKAFRGTVRFEHVPRAQNATADELATRGRLGGAELVAKERGSADDRRRRLPIGVEVYRREWGEA